MHFNWQVLIKADSIDEAEDKLEAIMDGIDKDNRAFVWDWYEIGGRWDLTENIINAEHPEFWDRVKVALNYQKEELKRLQGMLTDMLNNNNFSIEDAIFSDKKEPKGTLINYLIKKIAQLKGGYYCSESYFATDGSTWGAPELPFGVAKEIKYNPKSYYLINIDIHN